MISIILPTYNRATTIIRAVESVLNQTYKEIELLIIDDGSKDNTKQLIDKIKDERIKYVLLPKNMGACHARNVGIQISKGEYIAFQDSDDYWLPNKLEAQIKAIEAHNVDIVYCAMRRYQTNGEVWEKFPRVYIDYSKDATLQFLKENMAGTVSILFKKSCFEDVKFDEKMPKCQDWELMIRMSKLFRIFYMDDILLYSYVQEDSLSNNPRKTAAAFRLIYKKYFDEIEGNIELRLLYNKRIGDNLFWAREDGSNEYFTYLKYKFNFKIFCKYIICKFNLFKIHSFMKPKKQSKL